MEIITISFISLGILVLMLSFGVPLPYCFGGALMTMVLFGGATMNGTMVWGYTQLSNPVLLCIPLFLLPLAPLSLAGAFLVMTAVPAALILVSRRIFGGVNGDVVGAAGEITRALVLAALVVMPAGAGF